MKPAMEDVDVFNGPHARMRVLLDRMNVRLANTDFRDRNSVATLLFELQYIFSEFKQHEEIEDTYIVGELRTRMVRGYSDDDDDDDDTNDARRGGGRAAAEATVATERGHHRAPPPPIALEKDLHSDDRLRSVIHVISNVQDVTGRATCNRVVRLRQGQRLCEVLDEFTVDFVPHMVEEEQVFQPLLLRHFTALELIRLRDKVIQLHASNVRTSTSVVSGPLSTLAWWSRGLAGPPQLQVQQRQPEPPPAPPAVMADGGTAAGLSSTTIDCLPCELVLHILRLLDDAPSLLRASRVCRYWHTLAFDGSLWRSLYLRRWFLGQWSFSAPASYGDHADQSDEEDDEEEEGDGGSSAEAAVDRELLAKKESLWDYDIDDDVASPHKQRGARALWHEGEMSVRHTASEEKQFLDAVCQHLLPKVGRHARLLSLHGSTSLTNDLLRRILYLCPNIDHLSIAYTKVSTFGLDSRLHRRLTRLSASACVNISDVAVQKLVMCLKPASASAVPGVVGGGALGRLSATGGTPTTARSTESLSQPLVPGSPLGRTALSPEHGDSSSSSSSVGAGGSGRDLRAYAWPPRLWYLDLSGCHMLTDSGIEHLIGVGPHTDMIHLDLSGLHRITGETVKRLVAMCPALHPERFYYCERIPHGEDQVMKTAEMCRGICHKGIACCRLAC